MFGDRIKDLRTAEKLSQVELANKLGCSKQTVSNWENGNIQPSLDILIRIVDFFGCSSDYLLELDERCLIEVTNITIEQRAHIQTLVRDLATLNSKIKEKGDSHFIS